MKELIWIRGAWIRHVSEGGWSGRLELRPEGRYCFSAEEVVQDCTMNGFPLPSQEDLDWLNDGPFKVIKHVTTRMVQTCASCTHCFSEWDYEECPKFYCKRGSGPRPPCRGFNSESPIREYVEDTEPFQLWAVGRHVSEVVVCDHYEKKET